MVVILQILFRLQREQFKREPKQDSLKYEILAKRLGYWDLEVFIAWQENIIILLFIRGEKIYLVKFRD